MSTWLKGSRQTTKRPGVNDDLTGKKIADWTVIGPRRDHGKCRITWRCQCRCGSIQDVHLSNLARGDSKSCQVCAGLRRRQIDHGRVRQMLAEGMTGYRIAEELGIGASSVSRIRKAFREEQA